MRRLALLALLAPTLAHADAEYDRLIASAVKHAKIDNQMRVRLAYLQALQRKPAGKRAWLGLAAIESPSTRRLMLTEAVRRWPAIEQAGARRLKKFGRATKLEAVYLGRSGFTPPHRGLPSIDVGQQIKHALLVVHGIDAGGAVVPVDVDVTAKGIDAAGIARLPMLQTILQIRDRKSGAKTQLRLRIVGPPAKIQMTMRAESVGAGDLLHLSARISDAAGGRLWVRKLEWSAKGGGADRTGTTLRDAASIVPEDVPFEPHRNVVFGPREDGDYTGALDVTVRVPDGPSDSRSVTVIKGKTDVNKRVSADLGYVAKWADALAGAKKAGRPMLVFFEGDWCPFCRRLDTVTLTDKRIAALAKSKFVCIKVNADRSRALVERFRIADLPTIVFLSSEGIELLRMPNDYTNSAEKVLASMRKALGNQQTAGAEIARLRSAIAAAPESLPARIALAGHLRKGNQIEAARAAYVEALELAVKLKHSDAPALKVRLVWCALKLRDFPGARKLVSEFRTEYSKSDLRPKAEYYDGLAQAYAGQTAGAIVTWKALIARFPESKYARSAKRSIAKHGGK